jgi:cell wall assembly regulator SMI1
VDLQMTNVGPELSESDVDRVEEQLGASLPDSYRAFLLKFNGGRPDHYHFDVRGWRHQTSLVNDFNGIVPGEYNDLVEHAEVLEDRVPSGFIPIADDPGGNAILLSLEGPTRGTVYFWDHEEEPDDPGEALDDYPNIYRLADDFETFLEGLKQRDDEA